MSRDPAKPLLNQANPDYAESSRKHSYRHCQCQVQAPPHRCQLDLKRLSLGVISLIRFGIVRKPRPLAWAPLKETRLRDSSKVRSLVTLALGSNSLLLGPDFGNPRLQTYRPKPKVLEYFRGHRSDHRGALRAHPDGPAAHGSHSDSPRQWGSLLGGP